MITSISIKNYALIKELNIALSSGLNIITGETGAGKSIVIDALSLLLGARANKSNIRAGERKMTVSAQFDMSDIAEVIPEFNEAGIVLEDQNLILSREVDRNGKNVCRANGVIVPLSVFKRVGEHLIDIHSQHEHVSLFKSENQKRLLDLYSGKRAEEILESLKTLTKNLREIAIKIRELQKTGREATRQRSIDEYEYNEIEKVELRPGEDVRLEEEAKELSKREEIFTEVLSAQNLITSEESTETGISDKLSSLSELMDTLEKQDPFFKDYAESVRDSLGAVTSLSYELTRYIDRLDFEPEKISSINKRIYEIDELKEKYGETIDEILDYQRELYERLESGTDVESKLKSLKGEYKSLREEYNTLAGELSSIRKSAAENLKVELERELFELAMEKARVEIEVDTDTELISPGGQDSVTFKISVNPGIKPMPLSRVASGGEISRIMLALKGIFGEKDVVGTMIFDEIDTGISGRTAQVVAEKITNLSRKRQIIAITHLPQIAAMADSQFRVEKLSDEELTEVSFEELAENDRAAELSRMLGGAEVTELTKRSAEEMIEQARALKAEV